VQRKVADENGISEIGAAGCSQMPFLLANNACDVHPVARIDAYASAAPEIVVLSLKAGDSFGLGTTFSQRILVVADGG
jgi:hypothetical protein